MEARIFRICLLAMILARPLEAADPVPLLKSDLGSSFEVLFDQDKARLWLPVTPGQGIDPKTVTVKVRHVALGKVVDQRLNDCFRAAFVQPTAERAAGIELTITMAGCGIEAGGQLLAAKPDSSTSGRSASTPATAAARLETGAAPRLVPPGSYDLGLRVASGDEVQPLDLQLTVPEAKLKAISPLKLDNLLPLFGDATAERTLAVEEASRRAGLTGLRVIQEGPATSGDQSIDARLVFDPAPPRLPRAARVELPFHLAGDFPLGSARGNLEVSAAELKEPVVVAWEVKTRRSPVWLIGLILSGVGLGYLVRVEMQRRLELNRLEEQGLELVERCTREAGLQPDLASDEEFRRAAAALEAALHHPRPEPLTAAIQAQQETLTRVLARISTARQTLEADLRAFSTLLDTRWSLPAEFEAARRSARPERDLVVKELEQGRVGAASARLASARSRLGEALEGAMRRWRPSMRVFLETLEGLGGLLPAAVVEPLKTATATVKTALEALPALEAGATGETLTSALKGVHTLGPNAGELVAPVARWLERNLVEAMEEIQGVALREPATLEAVRTAVADAVTALKTAGESPEADPRPIHAALLRHRTAWRQALHAQIDPGAHEEIDKLIDQGLFLDATRAVRRLIERPAHDEGEVKGVLEGTLAMLEPHAAPVDPWVLASVLPEALSAAPGGAPVRVGPFALLPSEVKAQRVRSRWEYHRLLFLRTLLAAAGLTLVGYVLYAASFVGTLPEMTAIFFWAFGTDLSIEALTRSAAGLKKS